MEQENKTNEEEVITRQQISCGECGSMKQWLVLLTYNSERTECQLLCNGCGATSFMVLGKGLVAETTPLPTTKPDRNYLG